MFGDSVYKFNTLFSPCLDKQTNYLFKYDKKLAISFSKVRKNQWVSPTISNRFDICLSKIGGLNRWEIGIFLF